MPIIRHKRNEYQATTKGRIGKCERHRDDWDLAWNNQKVYVLDHHEWFDPHTSSKYHEGISHHAMYGPAVIVVSGDCKTAEYHCNDPQVWAWVRRCIAEGHLTAESMTAGTCNNEREVTVTTASVSSRS
jgi:hypothetical protein